MYAVEFETVSKDGVIYIPQEYKEELGNRDKIRLVVMYNELHHKEQNAFLEEINTIEKLFLNSNNQVTATKELVLNTDEMLDDIF